MAADSDTAHLLEQVVLECLGNSLYLDKLKSKVGVVTEWGAPSWLVLQRLSRKGAQSEQQLADARHVSADYMHRLLKPLAAADMVAAEQGAWVITDTGQRALDKLQQLFEDGLHEYADAFTSDELRIALDVLVRLRETVAADGSL